MILKYKQNRKLITVICDGCKNCFEKPESEYNRNIKFKRRNFCSRSCLAKNNYFHLKKYNFDLIPYSNNRKDEYTPYRYYLKNIKKRFKDIDITLEDLNLQWLNQSGICPYSGVLLVLSTHTKIEKNPIYAASLDRIDSSKGYIKGNIQFVSQSINYMKNIMSHEQTLYLCKLIANNFKS